MPNVSALTQAISHLDGTSEGLARYIRVTTAQGVSLARIALGILRDEQAPTKARTDAARFLVERGFVPSAHPAAGGAPSTSPSQADVADGG